MEAFEKQFRDAFEDYRLPVGEAAWQKVVAKQKRRPIWYLPLVRVAAAIALLVFSWFVFRAIQPGQDPSGTQQLPIAVVEPEQTQRTAPVEQADAEIPHALADTPATLEAPLPEAAPQQAPQPMKRQEYAATPTPLPAKSQTEDPLSHEQEPKNDIALHPAQGETPMQLLPLRKQELLPREHGALPLTQPRVDYARAPTGERPLHRRFAQEDRTMPERLIATLDRYKPRIVDDLVSLANRTTEIEINW